MYRNNLLRDIDQVAYWRSRYHKEHTLHLQLMEKVILQEHELINFRKNQGTPATCISELRRRLADCELNYRGG